MLVLAIFPFLAFTSADTALLSKSPEELLKTHIREDSLKLVEKYSSKEKKPMFSEGQKYFVWFFVVGFMLFAYLSFKADKRFIRTQYKGAYRILIGSIIIFSLFWFLVKFLNHKLF